MHSLAEAEQIAQNVLNKGIGVIKNDKIALDLNLLKWQCQCVKRQNGAVFEGFVGKAQIYRKAYKACSARRKRYVEFLKRIKFSASLKYCRLKMSRCFVSFW